MIFIPPTHTHHGFIIIIIIISQVMYDDSLSFHRIRRFHFLIVIESLINPGCHDDLKKEKLVHLFIIIYFD